MKKKIYIAPLFEEMTLELRGIIMTSFDPSGPTSSMRRRDPIP